MLDEQGTFTLIYRMLRKDEYVYVNMKAMRIDDDHLIIGVSSIDSQMKKQQKYVEQHRTDNQEGETGNADKG